MRLGNCVFGVLRFPYFPVPETADRLTQVVLARVLSNHDIPVPIAARGVVAINVNDFFQVPETLWRKMSTRLRRVSNDPGVVVINADDLLA